MLKYQDSRIMVAFIVTRRRILSWIKYISTTSPRFNTIWMPHMILPMYSISKLNVNLSEREKICCVVCFAHENNANMLYTVILILCFGSCLLK